MAEASVGWANMVDFKSSAAGPWRMASAKMLIASPTPTDAIGGRVKATLGTSQ